MDADGFETLFQDLEQMITTGYDLAKNMVLTDDMIWLSRAGLAAKCAVTSGFVNTWYLVAAAYGVAGFFGMDTIAKQYADDYYGVLCACQIEVDSYAVMFEQYGAFLIGPATLYYTDAACSIETTAPSVDCVWNSGTLAPCYSMVEDGDASTECYEYVYAELNNCAGQQGPYDCYVAEETDDAGTVTTAEACYLSLNRDCSTTDYSYTCNTDALAGTFYEDVYVRGSGNFMCDLTGFSESTIVLLEKGLFLLNIVIGVFLGVLEAASPNLALSACYGYSFVLAAPGFLGYFIGAGYFAAAEFGYGDMACDYFGLGVTMAEDYIYVAVDFLTALIPSGLDTSGDSSDICASIAASAASA